MRSGKTRTQAFKCLANVAAVCEATRKATAVEAGEFQATAPKTVRVKLGLPNSKNRKYRTLHTFNHAVNELIERVQALANISHSVQVFVELN